MQPNSALNRNRNGRPQKARHFILGLLPPAAAVRLACTLGCTNTGMRNSANLSEQKSQTTLVYPALGNQGAAKLNRVARASQQVLGLHHEVAAGAPANDRQGSGKPERY